MRIAAALAAAASFALAYTQSPLYTSNQNQYFLHGLARAGFGNLETDWLANTADPTPLFTSLVEFTYRLNQWEGLFYVYYAILMGIYLFSLVGIVKKNYPQLAEPGASFTLVTGLILVHSAGIRFLFSRLAGINWTYILEDGVADQRLLGSVFQPSTFGVFLLLSIYLFTARKILLAVACVVVAATIHPTYLLSAAVLVCVYMLLLFRENRGLRQPLSAGILALVLILPILVYVYVNFGNNPPETSAAARQILVDFRIPHHTDMTWWFDATALVKILLVLLAIWLARKSELFYIIFIPFCAALALSLIQAATRSPALALLFPWRMSTWLVPLSVATLLGWLISHLYGRLKSTGPHLHTALTVSNVIVILLAVSTGLVRTFLDFSRQERNLEQSMYRWISENHTAADRYLVPVKMQDFRLASGVPIFVDFKSIPYRDTDVLEWYRRIRLAESYYDDPGCNLLQQVAGDGGITHVVLPAETAATACPLTAQVYQDSNYSIYRLLH